MNNEYKEVLNVNYGDYIALSKQNTTDYLMISELIDNSISSFVSKYGDNLDNWKEKLIIKITISMDNETMKTPPSYGEAITFNPKGYIQVVDNAFGMNFHELQEALKLNRKNARELQGGLFKSDKNEHGRGLKQCAFYFGNSVEVITNNSYEANRIEINAINAKSSGETIFFRPELYTSHSRGTSIRIFNFNSSKSITKNKFLKMTEAIQARFAIYISKREKFEIIFDEVIVKGKNYKIEEIFAKDSNDCFLTKDNYSENTEILEKFDGKSLKPEHFKYAKIHELINEVGGEKEWRNYLSEMDNTFSNLKNNKESKNPKLDHQIMLENAEILLNVLKGNPDGDLKWKYIHTFQDDEFGEQEIEFLFWRQSKEKKPVSLWRGIAVSKGNRFIHHGPNKKEDMVSNYLSWENIGYSSGATTNWFCGLLDLTDKEYASTHTDKSSIKYPGLIEEKIKSIIYSAWYAFNEYMVKFQRYENPKDKIDADINSEKVIETLKSDRYSATKFTNNDEKIQFVESESDEIDSSIAIHKVKMKEVEGTWRLRLTPSNDLAQKFKFITNYFVDTTSNECYIYYNSSPSLFNNANSELKNEKYFTELVIPILYEFAHIIIRLELQLKKNNDNKIGHEEIKNIIIDGDITSEL